LFLLPARITSNIYPHLIPKLHLTQAIRAGLADAQRVIGSSASDQDKAEARVEVEVFESIQAALAK
jgi:hypothetical protein